MVGFVDDNNGQANLFHRNEPPSAAELVEVMRRDAQLWNDLVWVTGGALEPKKSSYHHIRYTFNPSGEPWL